MMFRLANGRRLFQNWQAGCKCRKSVAGCRGSRTRTHAPAIHQSAILSKRHDPSPRHPRFRKTPTRCQHIRTMCAAETTHPVSILTECTYNSDGRKRSTSSREQQFCIFHSARFPDFCIPKYASRNDWLNCFECTISPYIFSYPDCSIRYNTRVRS